MPSIRTLGFLVTTAALAFCQAAGAQNAATFPDRAIRIVVASSAGGSTDIIARLLAEHLRPALGQPVIVENRPGAAQVSGTDHVARAAPDGHTLLLATSSALVLQPHTHRSLPYDPARDFRMVSRIGTTPLVLFTGSSTPVSTVQDVVRAARAKPGVLTYGSFGTGSSSHLLGEYFARQADLTWVHVPYKGGQPAISDLLAGQLDFTVLDSSSAVPHVMAGRMKPLAVSGQRRSTSYPEAPTFAEAGIAGMEPFSPWWAVVAPARVSQPVVDRLSDEITRILRIPEVVTRLEGLGLFVSPLPASEGQTFMLDELLRWKEIRAKLPDVRLE